MMPDLDTEPEDSGMEPATLDARDMADHVSGVATTAAPGRPAGQLVALAPAGTDLTMLQMLDRAVQIGAGVDVLERLIALQERREASVARAEFDEAISAAKAEIPVIAKNRLVDFTGKSGVHTRYRHEDFAEVARTVDPVLGRHGLSYRFQTENDTKSVKVTCVLSHRAGYSERTSLTADHDVSGNKNSIQAIGSTVTYLQRMTLKAALGLAASDDDDGKASGDPVGVISAEQSAALNALADEAGADKAKLCAHFGIDAIPELSARDYGKADLLLRQRLRKAQEKAAS